MSYRQLISQLGFIRGNRAAILFSLYERKPVPGELLMDGIAVASKMRGKGIGTRLLEELIAHARREQFEQIRLDVIDTNPQARKLYERNGFVETKTEHFGYLRWLLGFGASTTMVYKLPPIEA
jgi:ribosomal protein S18 acetylase RimI-like enzyme